MAWIVGGESRYIEIVTIGLEDYDSSWGMLGIFQETVADQSKPYTMSRDIWSVFKGYSERW